MGVIEVDVKSLEEMVVYLEYGFFSCVIGSMNMNFYFRLLIVFEYCGIII